MNRYEGIHCPVCGKLFEEDDLITVCPVCGTPHHADCYRENGHCAHEDWHVSGKKFSAEEERKPASDDASAETKPVRCPRCGADCESDSVFCKHCGMPLNQKKSSDATAENGQPPYGQNPYGQTARNPYAPQGQQGGFGMNGAMGAGMFAIPPFAGMNPDEELSEGITVREYAAFIGPASTQYLLRFKRIAEKGRTISWNILFGLGNAFYLLYRKIYKWAIPLIIYLGLFLGVYIATTVLTLQNVYAQLGGSTVTMDSLYSLMESAMYDLPVWLLNAFIGMRYTLFPIILALGLFGDKIYYTHCTSRIHALKEEHQKSNDGTELIEVLSKKGGANRKVMMVSLIIAALAAMLVPFLSSMMLMM